MSWVVAGVAVAAVGTGYSIYSSEEAKKKQRLVEQAADRETQKIEQQTKDQAIIQSATEQRDKLTRGRRSLVNGGSLSTIPGSMPIQMLGSYSGKTLLGQ